MQRGMECDSRVWRLWNQLSWPPSAWKRRALQWKCFTKLCNTGRVRAIGSELLWQGFPPLFRVQQGEQGFAYQMLLIEQGAMQRKRWLVERIPLVSVQKLMNEKDVNVYTELVYQGENKLRVLLRQKIVQPWLEWTLHQSVLLENESAAALFHRK